MVQRMPPTASAVTATVVRWSLPPATFSSSEETVYGDSVSPEFVPEVVIEGNREAEIGNLPTTVAELSWTPPVSLPHTGLSTCSPRRTEPSWLRAVVRLHPPEREAGSDGEVGSMGPTTDAMKAEWPNGFVDA